MRSMRAVFAALFAGSLGCAAAQSVLAAEAANTKEKVVWSFGGGSDGRETASSLIDVNGTLYGTTQEGGNLNCTPFNDGCGTVFALDPKTGAETVLHAFCSQPNCADGESPYGGLVNVDGTLYGTATEGGAYGYGAVFAINPKTGAEKVVYSFCSSQNLCTDGSSPANGLIVMNGKLYGITAWGGQYNQICERGCGIVFALDPKTGTETVVYAFCSQTNCTDGSFPPSHPIDVKGTLYGTTGAGGTNDSGTVFALDPKTGAETVLYSFGGTDGAGPGGSLIDVKGMLYGTTVQGGSSNTGAVFAVDAKTGAETVVYSFCTQAKCADGSYPSAGVIDVNGTLYGATDTGGSGAGCTSNYNNGCGTVFALDPKTGAETVLYSFCGQQNCTDGRNPRSKLLNVKGTLYGTTFWGGANDYGTVFALKH